jgi:hypothetical protein
MSAFSNDARVIPDGRHAYTVTGPLYNGMPREGRVEKLGNFLWKSFWTDQQGTSHETVRQDVDEAIRFLIGDPQ